MVFFGVISKTTRFGVYTIMSKKTLFVISIIELFLLALPIANLLRAVLVPEMQVMDMRRAKNYFDDCVRYNLDNNYWEVIDEVDTDNQEILDVRSDLIEFGKSFRLHIDYQCEETQTILINNTGYHDAPIYKLPNMLTSVEYDFYNKSHSSIALWVYYSGRGSFILKNVYFVETADGALRLLTCVISSLICFDLFIVFRNRIRKSKEIVLTLLGITLLVSLPLLHYGIAEGHDLPFHFMRIEGLTQELKRGNIYPYIMSDCVDGYGYPTSVYYGSLFLYFPALLRVLGFELTIAYKLYVFANNILSVIVSYRCFKRMAGKKNIALVMSLAYVTCPYRLIDIYVRAAVGEYTAMTFLPIVAYGMWRIYSITSNERQEWLKTSIILTIGISGVLQSHILSVEMTVFFAAITALLCIKKTLRVRSFIVYILTIVETIILNAFFIVPFLKYYLYEYTKIKQKIGGNPCIQSDGAYITQLFSFFSETEGHSVVYNLNYRMGMTVGMLLMLTVVVSAVLIIYKKMSRMGIVLFALTVFSLWLSTDMFPWDFISTNVPGGNLLAQIQFPWRLLSVASIFSTLLFGQVLNELSFDKINLKYRELAQKGILVLCAVISIVSTLIFVSKYVDEAEKILSPNDVSGIDMKESIIGGEYLLAETNIDELLGEIIIHGNADVDIINRNGTEIDLAAKVGNGDAEISIPIFAYYGYYATDNRGEEITISKGKNGEIVLNLPKEFNGDIHIGYRVSRIWILADIISIFGLIIVVFIWFWMKKRCFHRVKGENSENSSKNYY